MNIALVGYGKMGKMIEEAALAQGHTISAIVDPFCTDEKVTATHIEALKSASFDCLIDFSSPKTILENLHFYMDNGFCAVIGTTGWYDELPAIEAYMKEKKATIIWSGNYSLGVACTLEILKKAGELFNKLANYDVAVHEIHHCHKMDAPSGTAIMMANTLIEQMDDKKRYTTCPNAKREEIAITSQRVGENPGDHTITFDSKEDTITINHAARSRAGFAEGAVQAAAWLIHQPTGLYKMDDFLHDFFHQA